MQRCPLGACRIHTLDFMLCDKIPGRGHQGHGETTLFMPQTDLCWCHVGRHVEQQAVSVPLLIDIK